MLPPAGEAHTLVIREDSPEPMVTVLVVVGWLIYLDKAVDGCVAAYADGFTMLGLCRNIARLGWTRGRQLI